ncbi:MAG: hypothetical protein GVY19_04280 [Bacteroidetes bacterium]|jgi:signal transduction histidine kinase|nr:hypothetical protein [Bacteroidota bacterium]
MKKEITKEISPDKVQVHQLVHHSILNIFHVIKTAIDSTCIAINDKNAFNQSLLIADELFDTVNNPYKARKKISNITIFKSVVLKEAEELLIKHYKNNEARELLELFMDNATVIFSLLKKRLTDLRIWGENVTTWEYFIVDEIIDDLKEFLEATSKNSQGRFSFVYLPEELTADNQYYVNIDIQPLDNYHVLVPTMLPLCIQDMIANSRKYTSSGGTIHVLLEETDQIIKVCVADDGIGIRENEIERVIEFGYRGSNIPEENSSAGGFGLTKAYYLTKQNNGRFWIDTKLNEGTNIIIEIPKP